MSVCFLHIWCDPILGSRWGFDIDFNGRRVFISSANNVGGWSYTGYADILCCWVFWTVPLQNEEAARIATFSQKSPPAKKQKKGLMQVFRLRAVIFRKYPPTQWASWQWATMLSKRRKCFFSRVKENKGRQKRSEWNTYVWWVYSC